MVSGVAKRSGRIPRSSRHHMITRLGAKQPEPELERILLQEYNLGKTRGDLNVIETALDRYKIAGGDMNTFIVTMAFETIANIRFVQKM